MFRTRGLASAIAAIVAVGLSPAAGAGQSAFSRPNATMRGELVSESRPLFAVTPGLRVARGRSSRLGMPLQVIGALGAAAVGIVAYNAVDRPGEPGRKVKGDWGYNPNANTAYAIGSFVGSTAAIYLAGQSDGARGSLASAAVGTGIATVPLLLGREEPLLPILGVLLGAPLQAVVGTAAYRSSQP